MNENLLNGAGVEFDLKVGGSSVRLCKEYS